MFVETAEIQITVRFKNVYVCMYVCVYVCMYVCMYVSIKVLEVLTGV